MKKLTIINTIFVILGLFIMIFGSVRIFNPIINLEHSRIVCILVGFYLSFESVKLLEKEIKD